MNNKNFKYKVEIFKKWCKRCGICVAFCPKSVLMQDDSGYPFITDQSKCIGCHFCELRCPDFAIETKVEECYIDTENINNKEKEKAICRSNSGKPSNS